MHTFTFIFAIVSLTEESDEENITYFSILRKITFLVTLILLEMNLSKDVFNGFL